MPTITSLTFKIVLQNVMFLPLHFLLIKFKSYSIMTLNNWKHILNGWVQGFCQRHVHSFLQENYCRSFILIMFQIVIDFTTSTFLTPFKTHNHTSKVLLYLASSKVGVRRTCYNVDKIFFHIKYFL